MVEKSQYKSLSEWKKVNPSDYNKAYREGWLDNLWLNISIKKPWSSTKVLYLSHNDLKYYLNSLMLNVCNPSTLIAP